MTLYKDMYYISEITGCSFKEFLKIKFTERVTFIMTFLLMQTVFAFLNTVLPKICVRCPEVAYIILEYLEGSNIKEDELDMISIFHDKTKGLI
jgi:hypothetical protein